MEIELKKEDISKIFNIKEETNKTSLQIGRAKPIQIILPLKLNNQLAKICGMIYDGSLSKNLSHVMFSQKKDTNKALEFKKIIKNIFNINLSIYNRKGTYIVSKGNKSLCHFLYYCLDIHKSDEHAKIPKWIYNSPKNIIKEYLRYAFAMEGSIKDPNLGNNEIKFHSCDLEFLNQLKKLLKEKFDINFNIQKYFIKNYGWKYYLHINKSSEIIKFSKIGFALKTHQERLNRVINLLKPKAWQITLVKLFNSKKNKFTIKEIHKLISIKFHKKTIHERVKTLIKKEYIIYNKNSKLYNLTNKGIKKASILKDNINDLKLRTNSKENEEKIFNFIKNNPRTWRNQIARSLKINVNTVRDVINRLIKQNKIEFISQDKFQRKFYKYNSGDWI